MNRYRIVRAAILAVRCISCWRLELALIASCFGCLGPAAAQSVLWTRQLGSASYDCGFGVSADGLGSVYISGYTGGDLNRANLGYADAFVSKFDAAGTLQWTRQLGSTESDVSYSVSADGLGNVYISGSTGGSLDGANQGSDDAFVSKFDEAGTLQWTRQLGSRDRDSSRGVSVDGVGNIYISGYSEGFFGRYDAFVSKFGPTGTLQWTRQVGNSESDASYGVSADGLGNIYISGHTQKGGEIDAFVAKIGVPEASSLTLLSLGLSSLLLKRFR